MTAKKHAEQNNNLRSTIAAQYKSPVFIFYFYFKSKRINYIIYEYNRHKHKTCQSTMVNYIHCKTVFQPTNNYSFAPCQNPNLLSHLYTSYHTLAAKEQRKNSVYISLPFLALNVMGVREVGLRLRG
jgi:hypothetical protein